MIRFKKSIVAAYVMLMAMFALGLFVVPMAIASLDIYLRKEPVLLNASLGSLPVPLGRWARATDREGEPIEDGKLTAEMMEELGTDQYLDRLYTVDGKNINVHVAYYTGMIDDVPHVPERCWDAAGLELLGAPEVVVLDFSVPGATDGDGPVNRATGEIYPVVRTTDALGNERTLHLPVGVPAMTVSEFQSSPDNPKERQVGGYFFIANGRMAPSGRDVRLLAFDPNEKYAYYCKVQFSFRDRIRPGESEAAVRIRFMDLVEEAMPQLLPEIMRCLPDWPTIERASQSQDPH
ncbi:MAG: exosortase-associated EpsI family protein [Phycisphaera sp.]|nr:exosortase-associated EpsI family protein [Phycisphaera sp.]